jgi:hypothetical protein
LYNLSLKDLIKYCHKSKRLAPNRGIAVFIGLAFAAPTFFDWLKSPEQKYQDETFVAGNLKPPKIEMPESNQYSFAERPPIIPNTLGDSSIGIKGLLLKTKNPYQPIGVAMGNYAYVIPLINFNYGVVLPMVQGQECGNIIFGIKDGRLYVSAEFKDLQKEEIIGIINFNHWKLYKPNFFDFKDDDTRLQVWDKQNNIVFALEYIVEGGVHFVNVNGYFINTASISVLVCDERDHQKRFGMCISKTEHDWKQKALTYISKIEPIFP